MTDAVTTTTATTTASTATAAAATANEEDAASALSSDFETFLTMLTVQMENQDPLNPVESTDFAVQLATFSGVEQQVRTNDLLEAMLSDQSLGGLADMAGWVGREALAPVAAQYDGAPVTVHTEVPSAADSAVLAVRAADGTVVSRIAIPAQSGTVDWNGTDASGVPVEPGFYSFEVESRSGDSLLGTSQAQVYSKVTEARLDGSSPVLVFANGETIPAESVAGIRAVS